MSDRLIIQNLPAFPDPAEQHPVGSAEWSARVSLRIHYAVDRVNRYVCGELMQHLRYAIPNKPWMAFPKDQPFRDLNAYLREIAGVDWTGLRRMVAGFDEALARELDTLLAENQAELDRPHHE